MDHQAAQIGFGVICQKSALRARKLKLAPCGLILVIILSGLPKSRFLGISELLLFFASAAFISAAPAIASRIERMMKMKKILVI
jgi:hypothetical protein